MKLKVAAKTDPGLLNDHNEDHFVVREDLGVYLVADGVGGLEAGELASGVACRVIEQTLRAAARTTDVTQHDALFADALRRGNAALFGLGRQRADRRGIGTTLVALWFHGDRALLASVGDSRIYLFRDGALRQLSHDEKVGRFRLAASLGQERTLDPPLGLVRLRRGDRFLLCTDGLHGPVPAEELAAILAAERQPARCCERLVASANEHGGPDNVTALVVDVVEPDPPQSWRFSQVRGDATSPLPRLLSPRVLGAAAVALAVAVLLILVLALARPGPLQGLPGRVALLATEANDKARIGDKGRARQALKELILHAVRTQLSIGTAELRLERPAAELLEPAAKEAWDELFAPISRKLATLSASQAARYVEPSVRSAEAEAEGIRDQLRTGHYEGVSNALAALAAEVDEILRKARTELSAEKDRMGQELGRLRDKAQEFAADNPIRRAMEEHLGRARKALDADDLLGARREVEAAREKLRGDDAEP
jgi:protein phosphatase